MVRPDSSLSSSPLPDGYAGTNNASKRIFGTVNPSIAPLWGSGICLLPIEIRIEIFEQVQSRIEHGRKPITYQPTKAPLLLTHVCSAWRRLVISIPTFWNQVTLVTNRLSPGHHNLLKLWLTRSKPGPLHVTLTDLERYDVHAVDFESLRPLSPTLPLKLLVAEADRWETLRLNFSMGRGSFERLSEVNGHLHGLKSLTIIPSKKSRQLMTGLDLNSLPFIEQVPALTIVRLMMGEHFLKAGLPTESLTNVDLVPDTFCLDHPLAVEECLKVVASCPNLAIFRVHCGTPYEPELHQLNNPRRVHCNTLRQLDVIESTFANSSETGIFLSHLHAPYLSHLSIISRDTALKISPHAWNDAAMSMFLSRIRPGSLKSLELQFTSLFAIHIQDGLRYLKLQPNIQKFHFVTSSGVGEPLSGQVLAELLKNDGHWPESLPQISHWTNHGKRTVSISTQPQGKTDKFEGGRLCRSDYCP